MSTVWSSTEHDSAPAVLGVKLFIRILDAATGELLRDLTLDPARDCQPTGAPKGPTRKPASPTPENEDPEP